MLENNCVRRHAVILSGPDDVSHATVSAMVAADMHVFAVTTSTGQARALSSAHPRRFDARVVDHREVEHGFTSLADELSGHIGPAGLNVLITEPVSRRPYPLEFVTPDLLRSHWHTHIERTVIAIQSLTPLLRKAEGRILINSTIGGRLTLPFSGVLSTSGHALRALADALRQELHPWSIDVVLIELAGVRNNDGFDLTARDALASGPPTMRSLYGSLYSAITENALEQERFSARPLETAAEVRAIATTLRPRRRYGIGRRARLLSTLSRLPTGVQDGLKRRMLAR